MNEKSKALSVFERYGKLALTVLLLVFAVAYPIAVAGVAFDVHPPFSLAWAGSALLFLEGTLLPVAAMVCYGWRRGLLAGVVLIVLSYFVEAVGVGTGIPFGAYRYTNVLSPKLPGSVPAAVMFAWVLIVLGAYGCLASTVRRRNSLLLALLGALLATLLDVEIEPVAFHLEHYWEWLSPGPIHYYGVPLANFAAWFAVAFLLLLCVDALFRSAVQAKAGSRRAFLAPRVLFVASLFMFGLVDLTHGYYGAIIPGLLAGLLLWQLWRRVPKFLNHL